MVWYTACGEKLELLCMTVSKRIGSVSMGTICETQGTLQPKLNAKGSALRECTVWPEFGRGMYDAVWLATDRWLSGPWPKKGVLEAGPRDRCMP